MHPTASEANLRRSLKTYLISAIESSAGKVITFDTSMMIPDLMDKSVTEWIVCNIGSMNRGGMSDVVVEFTCCTRGDSEGDSLAGLTDTVFDAMTDDEADDGNRRIPMLNQLDESIGVLYVQRLTDGPESSAADRTKFKSVSCLCRWVAVA